MDILQFNTLTRCVCNQDLCVVDPRNNTATSIHRRFLATTNHAYTLLITILTIVFCALFFA